MDKPLIIQVYIIAEAGEVFLEHAFLWTEKGDGCHAFGVHKKLEEWLDVLHSMYISPQSYFNATLKYAREHGIEGEACEYTSTFVSTFGDYLKTRIEFWFQPPFIFARLGDAAANKQMAQYFLKVHDDIQAGRGKYDIAQWGALGYFEGQALEDVRHLAATGEMRAHLRAQLNGHFAHVAIHNAKCEHVFRLIRDMPLASYGNALITAVVRHRVLNLSAALPITNEELRAWREKGSGGTHLSRSCLLLNNLFVAAHIASRLRPPAARTAAAPSDPCPPIALSVPVLREGIKNEERVPRGVA